MNRNKLGKCLLFAVLLFGTSTAAIAQDALMLGAVDTSAWPLLRVKFRLVIGGSDTLPPDPGRMEMFEESRPLAFTLRCDAPAPGPLALALGLERSLDSYFPQARDAALQALSLARIRDASDRVSLWAFSSTIDHELPLTGDSTRLASIIRGSSVANWPFNGTMLFEAMYRAVEEVAAAPEANRAVLFVTDGVNNTVYSNRTAADVSSRAAGLGVPVHVIGIRQVDAGLATLRSIAAATGGRYVHVTEAGAFDSLAAALAKRSRPQRWCEMEARSLYCANGASRNIVCRYLMPNGDTLKDSIRYTSPFLPDELDTLLVWSSPARLALRSGDTTALALGMTLSNGMQPPAFTLALPLRGSDVISVARVTWPILSRIANDTLYIDVSPPSSGLTDGSYTLARLYITSSSTMMFDAVPFMVPQPGSCLFAVQGDASRMTVLSLDTVQVERRSIADMQLRIDDAGLPEGAWDVNVRVNVDSAHARFDSGNTWTDGTGWRGSWSAIDDGSVQIQVEKTDSTAGNVLGWLSIRTLHEAPLRIPVTIGTSVVNAYGPAPQSSVQPGLIVLSDSCHPALLMLSGPALFSMSPNPASELLNLEFASPHEATVTLTLVDENGRPILKKDLLLSKGMSLKTLPIGTLPSGGYTIHCSSAFGSVSRQLRIVR